MGKTRDRGVNKICRKPGPRGVCSWIQGCLAEVVDGGGWNGVEGRHGSGSAERGGRSGRRRIRWPRIRESARAARWFYPVGFTVDRGIGCVAAGGRRGGFGRWYERVHPPGEPESAPVPGETPLSRP